MVWAQGGITAQPPPQTTGNQTLLNPSFASGSLDWTLPTYMSIDSTVGHNDTMSLKADVATRTVTGATQTITRTTVGSYTVSGWVLGDGTTDAMVKLSVFDTNEGAIVGETDLFAPTATWTQVQKINLDLLPLHNNHSLQIQVHVFSGTVGTVWFDDITLTEQINPQMTVFMKYPNWRGYLWSDKSQTMTVHVEVPSPTGFQTRYKLTDPTGHLILTHTQASVAVLDQNILFPPNKPAGKYTLLYQLLDSSGHVVFSYPSFIIDKEDPTLRATFVNYIDSDNFLVHKGVKQFVWGVYDRWGTKRCGAIGEQSCTSTMESAYLTIPGFNSLTTMQNYPDTNSVAVMSINPMASAEPLPANNIVTPYAQALDSVGAATLQIANFGQFGQSMPFWCKTCTWTQVEQDYITALTGQNGGLGYYTFDEADPHDTTLNAFVFGEYQTLKADNGSVNFGILAAIPSVFRYRENADVVATDPFPVVPFLTLDELAEGWKTTPVMGLTSLYAQNTAAQMYNARPIWMVAQLFDRLPPQDYFPSYLQMRQQAYKDIINGATGILWWGFVSAQGIEYEWYTRLDTQDYFDFKQISGEINGLQAYLITPNVAAAVSCSDPNIEFVVKQIGKSIYVITSNFNQFNESPVFTVTPTINPSITVYAENRSITATGQTFTDAFNPWDVHVYQLTEP